MTSRIQKLNRKLRQQALKLRGKDGGDDRLDKPIRVWRGEDDPRAVTEEPAEKRKGY